MAMPSRAAVSRSITSLAPKPWSCRSLATSVTTASLPSSSTIIRVYLASSTWIGIFQRVLELRPADAVFDGQVLKRLQKELNAFNAFELGLQAANHLRGGDFALIERLQVDLDAARVQRGVGSVHADERGDVIHGGVLQQQLHELLLALGHGGEADRLRRLADAQNHARILHREEALGNHNVEQQGSHQRADGDHQRDEAIAQNHLQGPPIRRR